MHYLAPDLGSVIVPKVGVAPPDPKLVSDKDFPADVRWAKETLDLGSGLAVDKIADLLERLLKVTNAPAMGQRQQEQNQKS
jgi:hypothetical protein